MAQDFLLDESGDLKIVNGDFAVGDAELQHIDDLVYSFKGEWKEFPLLGAEAQRLIKQRNGLAKVKKEIRQQLEDDGYKNVNIKVEGEEIQIDAIRI